MLWYNVIINLCARLFFATILFSLLCRTSIIRNTINTLAKNNLSKLKFIAIFVAFSLVDAFFGAQLVTRCINNQLAFVMVSGLIGGPIVGTATGLISSILAFFLVPYAPFSYHYILVILIGLIAGFFATWLQKQHAIYADASILGLMFTFFYLVINISLNTTTLPNSYTVEDILFPILFSYSIGAGAFMGILEDFYNQQEKIEGISAKTALKITNNSISILQDGLNTTSASETADIILQEAETFDFVAITSLDEILGFSSYRTEAPFVSFLVDDFQNLFKTSFKQDAKNLDVIRSYINVPIYNDKHHVGYFCVGHILDSETTPFETTLAHGLGTMITNQITVHSIKEKAGLYDKAEIKALQSQINPHFLFNALSTISFYCSQQPQTAKSLINDLASYYRNNLTDGNTMISILNELQHINAYIHLEQARFGDRLKVDYDINIEESFLVPALILQPIVENAIRHGLYQKLEGGRIIIRIDKQKNSFRIAVIDDGLGMTSDRLKHIFDNTKPKNSIGLTNVNQRLITLYGPKNKLKIYSSMNNGTIVIMKIPFQEVSENND